MLLSLSLAGAFKQEEQMWHAKQGSRNVQAKGVLHRGRNSQAWSASYFEELNDRGEYARTSRDTRNMGWQP